MLATLKQNQGFMPYSEFQDFRTKAVELNISQKIELITFLVQSLNNEPKKENFEKAASIMSLKGVFKESDSDENLKEFYMREKYGV